jgi:hypothetical protein
MMRKTKRVMRGGLEGSNSDDVKSLTNTELGVLKSFIESFKDTKIDSTLGNTRVHVEVADFVKSCPDIKNTCETLHNNIIKLVSVDEDAKTNKEHNIIYTVTYNEIYDRIVEKLNQ